MNNIHIPRLSRDIIGLLLLLAGIILFLYVTNIITVGLQVIILLGSLILMVSGFVMMDGPEKFKKLFNKRK